MFLTNNFLDDFFGDFKMVPTAGKMDIIEDEDKYIIKMDLPGFKKEDVKISLKDNNLTIAAEQNKESAEDKKYHLRERHFNKISRTIRVDNDITEKDILPRLEDGVLTLEVKKPEEKKPIDIEIK